MKRNIRIFIGLVIIVFIVVAGYLTFNNYVDGLKESHRIMG